jgi:hypothetical protein
MAEGINKAIEELEKKLEGIMRQASDIKKAINQLLALDDQPIRYEDTDVQVKGKVSIAPVPFFGKPLATAVRDFLNLRGQAVPLTEIHKALKQGGFQFTENEKFQLRGLSISLSKNSQTFVFIKSSNAYGLREWYPDLKEKGDQKKKLKEAEEPKSNNEEEKSINE